MSREEIDDLVAETIKGKPQFESAIQRMYKATQALNHRNVDEAFRKYLKKVATSDETEAEHFIAEMDRYVNATQITLDSLGSIDIDPKKVISNQFPKVRRILGILLWLFIGLAGLIFYFVAFRK